jgi:hypothetical protein
MSTAGRNPRLSQPSGEAQVSKKVVITFEDLLNRGRELERAAIVAWLRRDGLRAWGADCTGADETTFYADAIERGDHTGGAHGTD